MIKTEAVLVKTDVSICEDMPELRDSEFIKIVDGISPIARNRILGTGGRSRKSNGNMSVIIHSAWAGKGNIKDLACITPTSLEAVCGY